MYYQEAKQAMAMVDAWLAEHPERLTDLRSAPEKMQVWKQAAVRRVAEGNPYDTAKILQWFATKVEGPVMH